MPEPTSSTSTSMRDAFSARETITGTPRKPKAAKADAASPMGKRISRRKGDGNSAFIPEGTYYTTIGAARFLGVATVTIEHYQYNAKTLEPQIRFPRFQLFSEDELTRFKAEKPQRGVHHRVGEREPHDERAPRRKTARKQRAAAP
jgi:hypothetical protein